MLGLDGRSVGRGARLGRDVCAHGHVHGSVVTHGLVAHGVNFMDMTEPCGRFIGTVTCSAVRDARLGYSLCTARTGARLVWSGRVCGWTRPRFGRDARFGCTQAKLYGYD